MIQFVDVIMIFFVGRKSTNMFLLINKNNTQPLCNSTHCTLSHCSLPQVLTHHQISVNPFSSVSPGLQPHWSDSNEAAIWVCFLHSFISLDTDKWRIGVCHCEAEPEAEVQLWLGKRRLCVKRPAIHWTLKLSGRQPCLHSGALSLRQRRLILCVKIQWQHISVTSHKAFYWR